jgi:hypothetical protein
MSCWCPAVRRRQPEDDGPLDRVVRRGCVWMIGQAIGEVLACGVGVALSPLAIVAVVVMLVARGGALPA